MAGETELNPKQSAALPFPGGRMTRRQLLGLFAAGGGSALLSACEAAGAPSMPNPLAALASPAFEGYSIFYETMVEMVSPAIKQAASDGAIILFPVGIIEEHGPHIGLASDIYQACTWAKLTRRALLARGTPALIAPPMYWGMSDDVRSFPGTFSVSSSTMKALIYDIHASLAGWGFKQVFSFNLHGDAFHNHIYQEAIQMAHNQLGLGAYYVYPQGAAVLDEKLAVFLKDVPAFESIDQHLDAHAGAYETAVNAVLYPHNVNLEVAKTLKPSTSFEPLGYWGDPASYDQINVEDIKAMNAAVTTATVEAIEAVLKGK